MTEQETCLDCDGKGRNEIHYPQVLVSGYLTRDVEIFPCRTCYGTGKQGTKARPCRDCMTEGGFQVIQNPGLLEMAIVNVPCDWCNGVGYIPI